MNKLVFGLAAALALVSVPVFAGPMVGHPNLEAAHTQIKEAMNKISAAQRANEFDMGGHAQKAKDLLEQAEREIKLAAETANHR